jgi:hypothetical protein
LAIDADEGTGMGGPATAMNVRIADLLEFCGKNKIPGRRRSGDDDLPAALPHPTGMPSLFGDAAASREVCA